MPDGALEFLLKLDAQVDGALRMIRAASGAEEALKKLDKTSGGAEKKLKELNKEGERGEGVFKRFTKAGLEPFAEKLKSIAEFEFIRRGMDMLLELPEKFIDKAREMGAEIIKASGEMQVARMRFQAMFGKAEGNELLEYTDKLGKKTAVLDDQWRGIVASLATAGVKGGEQMTRATALVSDLAALSEDGPAAGAAQATSLLKRMRLSHEVNTKELVGFGIDEESFWKQLNKSTGIGVATLQKLMGQHKIGLDVLQDAIEKSVVGRTHEKLGDFGAEMGQSMPARVARLMHLPEQFFEKWETSPAFATLSDKIEQVLEKFDPDGPTGKRIWGAFENVLSDIVGYVDKINFDHVADQLNDDVIPALKTTFGVVSDIVTGLGIMAGWVGQFGRGAAGAPPKEAEKDMNLAQKVFTTDPLTWLHRGSKYLTDKMFGGGKDGGAGYAKGLKAAEPAAVSSAADVGFSSIESMRSSIDAHSPSRKAMFLGEMVGEGFIRGLSITKRKAGIESGIDLGDALSVTGQSLGSDMAPLRGRGGAAPPVMLNVTVSVNAGAEGVVDARAIGDAVAARLKEVLPSELAAALEQVVIEAGA